MINLNDKHVFVIGGARFISRGPRFSPIVEAIESACYYDLETSEAPRKAPKTNIKRFSASGCALNDTLYVYGGHKFYLGTQFADSA